MKVIYKLETDSQLEAAVKSIVASTRGIAKSMYRVSAYLDKLEQTKRF